MQRKEKRKKNKNLKKKIKKSNRTQMMTIKKMQNQTTKERENKDLLPLLKISQIKKSPAQKNNLQKIKLKR